MLSITKALLGIVLLTAPAAAFAQTAPPAKEIALQAKPEEWNYVLQVLQQRPYGEVAAILNKLAQQVQAQTPKEVKK